MRSNADLMGLVTHNHLPLLRTWRALRRRTLHFCARLLGLAVLKAIIDFSLNAMQISNFQNKYLREHEAKRVDHT